MTGLDRLRGYARRMDELHVWPGGAKLLDIAGQIEREHDADVADSPYDAIRPEDREAAVWVRDHGGLDHVKSEWSSRVPYDKHEQRRQRLLGHIAECEAALGRRNQRIKELGRQVSDLARKNAELRKKAMPEGCDEEFLRLHLSNLWDFMFGVMDRLGVDKDDSDAPDIVFGILDRRLMPDGMEWPRYEDGEQVRFGDKVPTIQRVSKIGLFGDGSFTLYNGFDSVPFERGERVRRPKTKILAADGKPLRVGERVWHVETGTELVVKELPKPGGYQAVVVLYLPASHLMSFDPNLLTHECPDTWERIEGDVMVDAKDYCEFRGIRPEYPKHSGKAKCEDIVRRCREVAKRERGER